MILTGPTKMPQDFILNMPFSGKSHGSSDNDKPSKLSGGAHAHPLAPPEMLQGNFRPNKQGNERHIQKFLIVA
jgi:hypothetical protein